MQKVFDPLKAIRKNCLDCSGGSAKYVTYCPCDGVHSTRCHLWPYRFGFQPKSVRPQRFVVPEEMPPAGTELESLPKVAISTGGGRKLSEEEKAAGRQRLAAGREKRLAGSTSSA